MTDVRPLLAVRYNPRLTSEIGGLIAPPYDVTLADRLSLALDRAAYNIGHLENVGLDSSADPHTLAASRYATWRREGVLVRDRAPALYLHRQSFEVDHHQVSRRGLLARVRLARWDEQSVLPHERTFAGPRQERLARLRAVKANLSPLYLLYRDPDGVMQRLLDHAEQTTPSMFDQLDVVSASHRLSRVADPTLFDNVARFFADRRLYVADGHHRYEAALAYRDEQSTAGEGTIDAPHNYVLALLADAADPGVRVLPTHRLVSGVVDFNPLGFRDALAELFELRRLAPTVDPAAAPVPTMHVCDIMFADDPGPWSLFTKPARPHEALMPIGYGPHWRSLDVTIVGTILIERLLAISPAQQPNHVSYSSDAAFARAALAAGDAQAAFLLNPISLEALMAVADDGDRLPAKSTYFDPKAPAGLVINELTMTPD